MSDHYAVFIGDVALDEFYTASQWPASGTKIDLYPVSTETGGMIANAAAVYAGFGEDARFLWAMNSSSLSDRLLADLWVHGVDTSLVIRERELADSRNIIVLHDSEHTVMTPSLGLETIDVSDYALSVALGARYVYTAIGDLRALRHHGVSAAPAIRNSAAQLVLDLDVANLRPGDDDLITQADIVIFNRVGFQRYSDGRNGAIEALLTTASVVVVTLGAAGCRVVSRDESFDVPGLPVEVVDVTGAGDTFGAAFLHALNRSPDLHAAATFANAAAARAVTAVGARAGITQDAEVESFLRQYALPLGWSPDTGGQGPAAPSPTERPVP
jgi:ribokinase